MAKKIIYHSKSHEEKLVFHTSTKCEDYKTIVENDDLVTRVQCEKCAALKKG